VADIRHTVAVLTDVNYCIITSYSLLKCWCYHKTRALAPVIEPTWYKYMVPTTLQSSFSLPFPRLSRTKWIIFPD